MQLCDFADEMEDLIDQDLMVEKCNILFSRNRLNEFYDTALQLFSRHCPEVRNYDEAHGTYKYNLHFVLYCILNT